MRLGIDIGGTQTKYVLKDRDRESQFKINTGEFQSIDLLFESIFNGLGSKTLDSLESIGVCAPGMKDGSPIFRAHNLKFGEVDVSALLKVNPRVDLHFHNDGNAHALYELQHRSGGSFCVVSIGTGLGVGVVDQGRLVLGYDGSACEAGHNVLYPGGRRCGCGGLGHAEAYISKHALMETARTVGLDCEGPKELAVAARGDSLSAKWCFDKLGHDLGVFCASLVASFRCQSVIFSGGLSGSRDLFFDSLMASFEKHSHWSVQFEFIEHCEFSAARGVCF